MIMHVNLQANAQDKNDQRPMKIIRIESIADVQKDLFLNKREE